MARAMSRASRGTSAESFASPGGLDSKTDALPPALLGLEMHIHRDAERVDPWGPPLILLCAVHVHLSSLPLLLSAAS